MRTRNVTGKEGQSLLLEKWPKGQKGGSLTFKYIKEWDLAVLRDPMGMSCHRQKHTASTQREGEVFAVAATDARPPGTNTPHWLPATTVLVLCDHMMDSRDDDRCRLHTDERMG